MTTTKPFTSTSAIKTIIGVLKTKTQSKTKYMSTLVNTKRKARATIIATPEQQLELETSVLCSVLIFD